MEVTIAKVATAVILFVLTLVFGFIPYLLVLRGSGRFTSGRRRDCVIAYLNCFAGGVFLATLLIHILAEGSEEFEDYKEKVGLASEFPLFNLLVAAGFFLVAFVELFAQAQMSKDHNQDAYHSLVNRESDSLALNTDGSQPSSARYGAVGDREMVLTSSSECNGKSHPVKEDAVGNAESVMKSDSSPPSTSNPESVSQHHHHVQSVSKSKMRAFLLLIALSFHTIFDGLAVGLQTQVAEVWFVFAAITVHKSIISFCLGLELFQSSLERPWRAIVWLTVFALMSPLGIGVGVALTSGEVNERDQLLASSLLQGLAAGTFLYVTFLEILNAYIGHNSEGKWTHALTALIGFVVMATTKLFDQD